MGRKAYCNRDTYRAVVSRGLKSASRLYSRHLIQVALWAMRAIHFLVVVLVGMGATLLIDLWSLFLRRVYGVRSLDYCLLGRWVLHMRHATFLHESITAASRKPRECLAGWIIHYSIGIALALLFVLVVSGNWLAQPTFLPALAFGILTVVMPFFVMQPALGLGVASSKTPNPKAARLKSLATHAVFGAGLYVWAHLLNRLLR